MVIVSGVRRNDCKQELHERINLNDNDDDEDDDTVEPLHNRVPLRTEESGRCREMAVIERKGCDMKQEFFPGVQHRFNTIFYS